MSIMTLGEKRGQLYRNGELIINEKYWDMMKKSFEAAFDDEVDLNNDEIIDNIHDRPEEATC